jgi:hypothetical protein
MPTAFNIAHFGVLLVAENCGRRKHAFKYLCTGIQKLRTSSDTESKKRKLS